MNGAAVDLRAINGAVQSDAGVAHGAALLAFTDAVMHGEEEALRRARRALRGVLSDEAFVDACAVIGGFNVVDRIADATGIPLDPQMAQMSGDLPQVLNLTRFASAANTLGS